MFTDSEPTDQPDHDSDSAPFTAEFASVDVADGYDGQHHGDDDLPAASPDGDPVDFADHPHDEEAAEQQEASDPTATAGEQGTSAPDIVYVAADGTHTDLGAPNEDLNGDGIAESVAVRTDGGDILVLSDTDADGHPDQLIQVDPQTGEASWAVPNGHGGWDIVQTGHLQADGSLVVDQPRGIGGAPEKAGDQENVEVAVGGRSFDAGPATIDSDGDGVPDTVAVAGAGGSTLYYQDSDGDGVADKAWTADSAGHVTANYALAPGGQWVSAPAAGSPS